MKKPVETRKELVDRLWREAGAPLVQGFTPQPVQPLSEDTSAASMRRLDNALATLRPDPVARIAQDLRQAYVNALIVKGWRLANWIGDDLIMLSMHGAMARIRKGDDIAMSTPEGTFKQMPAKAKKLILLAGQ